MKKFSRCYIGENDRSQNRERTIQREVGIAEHHDLSLNGTLHEIENETVVAHEEQEP